MKNFTRFTLLVMCLASLNAHATHLSGGNITYQWVSGNSYLITFNTIQDCIGSASAVPTAYIHYASATCGLSGNITLNLVPGSPTNVVPVCAGTLSHCNGGSNFGLLKAFYTGIVTLPQACTDWTFSNYNCCRNSYITNLDFAHTDIYIEATLNNLSAPFNNSPVFMNEAGSVLTLNQTHRLSFAAYDVDGDSLAYSLTSPLYDSGSAYLYNASYSASNPIVSTPPSSFNSITGEFTVTPTQQEMDVVVVEVREYRQGILIGTVRSDVIESIETGTNTLPDLTGINGTSSFTATICADSTLTFSLLSSDANPGDSTLITTQFLGQPNNFTVFSASQHPSATFSWTPDTSQISSVPYIFTATVQDNSCTYNGWRTYVYRIYVNQCITDDVWPGDANSDLAVNMYDLLPIGLGYNATGPLRTGASTSWTAQPASNWTQSFSSGKNYKHADCNGNGIIDSLDRDAIALNYQLSHLRSTTSGPGNIHSVFPDLMPAFTPDTVTPFSPVSIDIKLGNSTLPATDLYGITFTLNYDQDLIQPGSFVFSPAGSWLGNTSDMIHLVQGSPDSGFADIGLVRINQVGVTGNGTLGTIHLITNPLVAPGSYDFTLSNVKAITSTGADLPMNILSDSLHVVSATSIPELDEGFGMNIFTDVNRHEIRVSYTLAKPGITDLRIISVLGQEVKELSKGMKSAGPHSSTYDISDLPAGIYLIDLFQNNRRSFQKIIIGN